MRSLFPIHRPRLGLSFRAHSLDLVELRRPWRRAPTVTRLSTRPLPAGLLTPVAAEPNTGDPAALAKELHALLHGVSNRTVAIDLPIACCTLALFHFETFPAPRAEQEALLRWRLRQDEHLAAGDLTLRWQVAPLSGASSTAVSVLLVAIRQSILDQYHRVCEDADLIPVSMGFSTLHLLTLARMTLPEVHEDVCVAHRTAESLIVLAFRQGRPLCLRVKPMRRTSLDLKTELIQTLQYFRHTYPLPNQVSARTTPVYVVEEGVVETAPPPADWPDVWTLSEDPSWTVPVHRATWTPAPIVSTVAKPAHPPFAALASVLAA